MMPHGLIVPCFALLRLRYASVGAKGMSPGHPAPWHHNNPQEVL